MNLKITRKRRTDRNQVLYFIQDTVTFESYIGLTAVCFAGNVTRHPVYREYLKVFPNADRIMAEGFLLGAHHGMTVEDVDYVCDKIKEFFRYKYNLF